VCVVTSRLDRHDHAMTANAFMSVSLEPLLVVVSVAEDTRFLDAVVDTGRWGVSILAERQRAAARWLATPGRPVIDQLSQVPHRAGPLTGVALLVGSLATMECRTSAIHRAGDHHLVVGEVIGLELPADPPPPLVYHQGAYRHLSGSSGEAT
jgi:flavin reductase (DIM6/NTAB) family NADH-FMN oxidoreductase RutF